MATMIALPDGIDLATYHFSAPFGDLAKFAEDIAQANVNREAAAQQLATANARIQTLEEKNRQQGDMLVVAVQREATLTTLLGVPVNGDVVGAVKTLLAENVTLRKRIEDMQPVKPPVVTEPPKPPPVVAPVVSAVKPIITKTELKNVAGFCVTLGRLPPSATVDATARELIVMGRGMGFNCVRFFRNKDEVAADLKRTPDDLRNLYAFAQKQGMVVVADTINRAAYDLNDAELKTYLAGLKTLGTPLYIFDDGNQYREAKNADGKLKYPAGTLERLVKRVRDLQPDMPIMASLTAGAVIKDYEPLFDFTEAQTFGSSANLDTFLDRGFDAYCLDGQASASLDYLRRAHDIILKDNPTAVFWYTASDEKTNWLDMDDKTALIEKTVKALTAQWGVKA